MTPTNTMMQRYVNEHIHLTKAFFTDPLQFMMECKDKTDEFFAHAYNHTDPQYRFDPNLRKYTKDDFIAGCKDVNGRYVVLVAPPKPEMMLQCHFIGCSVKHDGSNPMWRVIERDPHEPMYCAWDENHVHYQLESILPPKKKFLTSMMEDLRTEEGIDPSKIVAMSKPHNQSA